MSQKRPYVFLFDGYADWEISYGLPELRRFGKVDPVTVGFTAEPVVSMAGLRVKPDTTWRDIDLNDILIWILPGGFLWEKEYPLAEMNSFLARLEQAAIPMAAICAATTVFARAGLLRGRKFTSNSLDYLAAKAPGSFDPAGYVQSLAARDRHVITASGLGAVEFAIEIFNELNLMPEKMRPEWYDAFKHGICPADFGKV